MPSLYWKPWEMHKYHISQASYSSKHKTEKLFYNGHQHTGITGNETADKLDKRIASVKWHRKGHNGQSFNMTNTHQGLLPTPGQSNTNDNFRVGTGHNWLAHNKLRLVKTVTPNYRACPSKIPTSGTTEKWNLEQKLPTTEKKDTWHRRILLL